MRANIELRVQALLAAGRRAEAVALVEAADRDPNALVMLATWLLGGETLPRDLPRARAALRRAAMLGHAHAAQMEIALTANGSGGTPDWKEARRSLDAAAAYDQTAARQLCLINAMKLTAEGYPLDHASAIPIGSAPTVLRCEHLLTPEECAHIAHAARDLLQPGIVVDPQTGRNMIHPVRTSHNAVIGPTREDLVVAAIHRRVAAMTATDFRQGEPLSVLHYAPGQEYKPHYDALPATNNQRIKTVLLYLNEGFGGGETLFLNNGLKITPRAGDAIIFDNVDVAGRPDKTTQHASLPVTHGAKWLATRWIRERPYNPWTDYGT